MLPSEVAQALGSVRDFTRGLRGKLVLLYGLPMVGKTWLSVQLTHKFGDGILFWVDENLKGTEYGKWLKTKVKGRVVEVANPLSLDRLLYKVLHDTDAKYVVVDSITGVMEYIMSKEGPESPRVILRMSRHAVAITHELAKFAHERGACSLLVAHETPTFEQPWLGVNARPSFLSKGLKNVDMVLYLRKDGDKRILRCLLDRSPPTGENLTNLEWDLSQVGLPKLEEVGA